MGYPHKGRGGYISDERQIAFREKIERDKDKRRFFFCTVKGCANNSQGSPYSLCAYHEKLAIEQHEKQGAIRI